MGGVHNMLLGTSITAGKLTLKEVVFNASGTFTMPTNVVNNQVIVGCTGGGAGCYGDAENIASGGGSGRVSTTLTLSAGSTCSVIVGAGGFAGTSNTGGTSSFAGTCICGGGTVTAGVSGGGNGSKSGGGGSSSCPAILTLASGASDSTTKLYTAKSYAGGAGNGGLYAGGGAGCYGDGANGWAMTQPSANTGGGGYSTQFRGSAGGSGKVVVYYYVYE